MIADAPIRDYISYSAVRTYQSCPLKYRFEATFDEAKLDRTKRVVENVWSAIESGHFYPAPSPMQCPGCGYRNHCAAWRGKRGQGWPSV